MANLPRSGGAGLDKLAEEYARRIKEGLISPLDDVLPPERYPQSPQGEPQEQRAFQEYREAAQAAKQREYQQAEAYQQAAQPVSSHGQTVPPPPTQKTTTRFKPFAKTLPKPPVDRKLRHKIADVIADAVKYKPTKFTNQKGEPHQRNLFLNASEAWNCLRRTGYEKIGAPKDPEHLDTYGYFERGHSVEAWAVQRIQDGLAHTYLKRGGEQTFMTNTGASQHTYSDEETRLSATPDALLCTQVSGVEGRAPTDYREVLEIKSYDPRTNVTKLPKPEHVLQVEMQIALVNKVTGINIQRGRLVYVNASDFEETLEFFVALSPDIMDRMAWRAKTLFDAISATQNAASSLPTEGLMDGGCQYCPFSKRCQGARVRSLHDNNDAKSMTSSQMARISNTLETLDRLEHMAEKIAGERGILNNDLRDMMVAGMAHTVDTETGKVTYSKVKGRQSIDKKKMVDDGIDVDGYMRTGPESDRLTTTSHVRRDNDGSWSDCADEPEPDRNSI